MRALRKVFDSCKPLIVFAPIVLLSSCGGGGDPTVAVVNDVGNTGSNIGQNIGTAIGQGFSCALERCSESSTIPPDHIQTYYTVTQSGSDVHVDTHMSKSNAFISTLELSPGDSLSATVDNQAVSFTSGRIVHRCFQRPARGLCRRRHR